MDLNTVEAVLRPAKRADLEGFGPGDAWLAGGTWLFSEPQRELRRLIDLSAMNWPALELDAETLSVGATCPIATLESFDPPPDWNAGWLIARCCQAFWASFKIWNMATVGGNLCLALPAGPMISLFSALQATCVVWQAGGGERRIAVDELVLGPQQTALAPGDLLRCIDVPLAALRSRAAFRQASLTPLGRSAALLIGMRDRSEGFRLVVTASTPRPVVFRFTEMPDADALRRKLDSDLPAEGYFDDVHGAPDWRRHLTREFAEEIREELGS